MNLREMYTYNSNSIEMCMNLFLNNGTLNMHLYNYVKVHVFLEDLLKKVKILYGVLFEESKHL